jgi:hypothetical protein
LFKYDEGKAIDATLYESLVVSLRYLTCMRPDIVYGVGLISRYMEEPKMIYWKAIKWIILYMKDTLSHSLFYFHTNEFDLDGYSDRHWSGGLDDWKSTPGFIFFYGWYNIYIVIKEATNSHIINMSSGVCCRILMHMWLFLATQVTKEDELFARKGSEYSRWIIIHNWIDKKT